MLGQVKIPKLIWLTIAVLVLGLGFWHRTAIFAPYQAETISTAYSQSQYVLGDKSPAKIDDATLYQYAAAAYLNGEDPATINFEHPPLGKYFYGVFLRTTGWILLTNLVFLFGCLVLTAQLLAQFKVRLFFQIFSLVYLALLSGMSHHLTTSLLDLQTLFWSLAFFVVLFEAAESWLKYLRLGIVLGAFIATKYFFPIVFLYLGLLAIWSFSKKTFFKAALSLAVMAGVYLLSYGFYFSHQHSLVDFIKFEWYRFKWWTGNRTIPQFIILQTLFLGKFPMWWSDAKTYMADGDWNISWPFLFVAHLVSAVRQQRNLQTLIVWLFSTGLLVIFMVGSAVYGRYFFQLFPFWLLTIGALNYAQKPQTSRN